MEEMDKRVITSLHAHEEMSKKEACRDIQGPEKYDRVWCAPKGFAPSQLQSIGLLQLVELSEISTSLLEYTSEIVRKEFDENYRARVRAEMAEYFEGLLTSLSMQISLNDLAHGLSPLIAVL
ncbi:hypothetical protein LIER_21949 [Lithospermum erythrorhizon]|uniref:Uncharacterized protein n=1 Tax=Lithospermum erythrorhizon TaxID=34254 RepID=A0AAV3QTL1_LITER